MLGHKFKILISLVISIFNITSLFSEEITDRLENKDTMQEEIRWLQAETFQMEITLASRKLEKLSETAAAIYVITQEGIRRSGATSIPEVLRMVPGLNIARIDANKWAVTSRGFNGRFANKLLVLIDGRSVYTPLFSGVYWDAQNVMLEDVERIEVIRGPGSSLWGANAVNGIINVITKNSENTQDGLLSGMAGTEERVVGGVRYGGKLGKDAYYRLYARYFNHDDFSSSSGNQDSNDKWDVLHGGGRFDWGISAADSLTIQGDYYNGDANEIVSLDRRNYDFSGGNMLAHWKHIFSGTSEMDVYMYYDRTYRKTEVFRETRDTFSFDFQHRFQPGSRNDLVWGLNYRYTSDKFAAFRGLDLDPDSRGLHLIGAFIQNEITLIKDRLRLFLGSKFIQNDYVGFEFQPSARMIWTPTWRHTIWGSVSRAVRTPSRSDRDFNQVVTEFPLGGSNTGQLKLLGNKDFVSEDLLAFELGYRVQVTDKLSLDIASFYNKYDDLRTIETGEARSVSPALTIFPLIIDNNMDGDTYGLEISANMKVNDYWSIIAGYAFLQMQLHTDSKSNDAEQDSIQEGLSPQNQGSLLSYLDLPYNTEFDTFLYYVDHLSTGDVSSYLRLDMRLGWKPTESLDISIGMKNILDSKHQEFRGTTEDRVVSTEVERSVYAKVEWLF